MVLCDPEITCSRSRERSVVDDSEQVAIGLIHWTGFNLVQWFPCYCYAQEMCSVTILLLHFAHTFFSARHIHSLIFRFANSYSSSRTQLKSHHLHGLVPDSLSKILLPWVFSPPLLYVTLQHRVIRASDYVLWSCSPLNHEPVLDGAVYSLSWLAWSCWRPLSKRKVHAWQGVNTRAAIHRVSLCNTQNLKLLAPQDWNGLTLPGSGVPGTSVPSTCHPPHHHYSWSACMGHTLCSTLEIQNLIHFSLWSEIIVMFFILQIKENEA